MDQAERCHVCVFSEEAAGCPGLTSCRFPDPNMQGPNSLQWFYPWGFDPTLSLAICRHFTRPAIPS